MSQDLKLIGRNGTDQRHLLGMVCCCRRLFGVEYQLWARYCFGIFVKPMAADYQWARSVISLGASINMFVYSACAIYIGRLLDKMAPRWIITAGAFLAALSLILTSFVKTPFNSTWSTASCSGRDPPAWGSSSATLRWANGSSANGDWRSELPPWASVSVQFS